MKKYLFYLILLVWPFGLLLSYQTPFIAKPVYLLDIFTGIFFSLFIISKKERSSVFKNHITPALLLFFTSLTLSLLLNLPRISSTEIITSALYLIRVIIYPTLYYYSLSLEKKELLQVTSLSFAIFTFIGLTQYLFVPDLRFLKLLGFDDHLYRLAGSLFDPNFAGAIFASVIFFFIYSGQHALVFLSLLSLVLTFSRASYLAFILGCILYAFAFKKNKVLFAIAILCVGVVLSPKPFGEGVNLLRTFSVHSRLGSWADGISLFIQKPIFGWGYNTLSYINQKNNLLSNSFIQILATSGLLGFLSFLYLLQKIFKTIPKINQVVLLSILIHSFFNNSFFYIWIMALFWLAAGINLKEYK